MNDLAKKVDNLVGRQIRKRRNLLGLTQEQLADALGISYQQVQKYETAANRGERWDDCLKLPRSLIPKSALSLRGSTRH